MTPMDRIDELLLEQGKSRQDLANAVGISTSAISTWKKRNSMPLADTAVKIADYLKVTTKYLLTGVNEVVPIDPKIDESVRIFYTLSKKKQELVLTLIKELAD